MVAKLDSHWVAMKDIQLAVKSDAQKERKKAAMMDFGTVGKKAAY